MTTPANPSDADEFPDNEPSDTGRTEGTEDDGTAGGSGEATIVP
jgi:hypothetical protein